MAHISKTCPEYWAAKIERNRTRDASKCRALRELGWDVLVIWECETKNYDTLRARIHNFQQDTPPWRSSDDLQIEE